jgi:hypothetical protein
MSKCCDILKNQIENTMKAFVIVLYLFSGGRVTFIHKLICDKEYKYKKILDILKKVK